jgi:NADPH2:quinone reductase
VKTRAGLSGRHAEFPLIIPHSDGAGEIDAVGDGVAASRRGERVWVYNAQWKRPFGTAAQYTVVPARLAVPLPDEVGYAEAACFGIPLMTALHAVRLAGAAPGRSVLVQGGAGAVGHYAVQIAKRDGATVIATVSSPEKGEHARRAGADHVIDYRREDLARRIRAVLPAGVDRVIEVDIAGNAPTYADILAPRAEAIVYGTNQRTATIPAGPSIPNAWCYRFFIVYDLAPETWEARLGEATALIGSGALRHRVARRFPLAEIAAAHEAVEQGAVIGNVVIDIPA